MKKRIALVVTALLLLVGGLLAVASAAPGDVTLVCPHVASPVDGQQITCTYRVEAVSPTTTPPPTTTTTSSTTTTAPTTTTVPPVTTTTTVAPTTTTTPPAFGFPTEATTGPADGLALTAVNSSWSTTSAGEVIDGKSISGDLVLNHDNVVVRNSRIKGRVIGTARVGLVLDHVDLGPDTCPGSAWQEPLIKAKGYTISFSHVHNAGADLIQLGYGGGVIRIEDSLLNRTCYYNGAHLDAFQVYDNGSDPENVTITRSSLDSRAVNTNARGNAAIQIGDEPPDGSRYVLTDSQWAGGGYTLRLYDISPSMSKSYITLTGNTIVKGSYQYAPCVSSNSADVTSPTQVGLYQANNKLSDGSPVTC